ncbi:MAG: alpha/beta fold hydrolase, partial [Pseudomonadota bacterium]
IVTYAYDQRGFGRGATRGRWPGADALIADARDTAAAIRDAHPGIPLAIVGHSMGGGVALAAVGEGAKADGLILAAPAVWGGDQLAPPYRIAAWAGAALFPEKRWTGEGIVRIQASDNIQMLRRLGRDRYYLGNPSSREFMGLIRIMDRAIDAAPSVATPTLTIWGEKDQVLARGPIDAAHGLLAGEKQMIVYPEGWHLLFRDLQAETVWRDVADWIEELT